MAAFVCSRHPLPDTLGDSLDLVCHGIGNRQQLELPAAISRRDREFLDRLTSGVQGSRRARDLFIVPPVGGKRRRTDGSARVASPLS